MISIQGLGFAIKIHFFFFFILFSESSFGKKKDKKIILVKKKIKKKLGKNAKVKIQYTKLYKYAYFFL